MASGRQFLQDWVPVEEPLSTRGVPIGRRHFADTVFGGRVRLKAISL
jgi:hypothetical protein